MTFYIVRHVVEQVVQADTPERAEHTGRARLFNNAPQGVLVSSYERPRELVPK